MRFVPHLWVGTLNNRAAYGGAWSNPKYISSPLFPGMEAQMEVFYTWHVGRLSAKCHLTQIVILSWEVVNVQITLANQKQTALYTHSTVGNSTIKELDYCG